MTVTDGLMNLIAFDEVRGTVRLPVPPGVPVHLLLI